MRDFFFPVYQWHRVWRVWRLRWPWPWPLRGFEFDPRSDQQKWAATSQETMFFFLFLFFPKSVFYFPALSPTRSFQGSWSRRWRCSEMGIKERKRGRQRGRKQKNKLLVRETVWFLPSVSQLGSVQLVGVLEKVAIICKPSSRPNILGPAFSTCHPSRHCDQLK